MAKTKNWKSMLKQDERGDLVCELNLPRLSSLRIHPKKDADGAWRRDDVRGQLDEVETLAEQGKIPISVSSFMGFLSARMPGIPEDFALPMDYTLIEWVKMYVKALKDEGHKIAKESPYKHKEETSIECTFHEEDTESLGPEHIKAVDYLLANESHVCDVILQALCKDYAEFEDEKEQESLTPDQMRKHSDCRGIYVTQEHHKKLAYIEYSFQLSWLGEDQWTNVVLHGDRVVFVGSTGAGWSDPEAQPDGKPAPKIDPVAFFAAHRKALESKTGSTPVQASKKKPKANSTTAKKTKAKTTKQTKSSKTTKSKRSAKSKK